MTEFKKIHSRANGSWQVQDQKVHGQKVRSMFTRISGVYDFMNHLLSFNRDKKWRQNVVARLDENTDQILDLCAGTGDLALTCVQAGVGRNWIAADFCSEMLEGSSGKKNAEHLKLAAADAMSLPFADNSFNAVTVGFGVRNFADVRQGAFEIARVLKPGGQLLVLEFFRDDPQARGNIRGVPAPIRFVLNTMIPLVGRIFGRDSSAYSYLPNSMGEFLTTSQFETLLQEYNFTEMLVERQTMGIAFIVGGRLEK